GIDASSPGEVELAAQQGFTREPVSFTGTNLSERDLDALLPCGVHVNLDLLSQLRRFGRRAPGRTVGIRVNPRAGGAHAGGGETLFTGAKATKVGLYPRAARQEL